MASGARSRWDLAVVDLFLSEGSGLGVVREFGGRCADQLVVMLTSYPTGEMRNRCLALGADAIFDKSNELEAFFTYLPASSSRQVAADGASPEPLRVLTPFEI